MNQNINFKQVGFMLTTTLILSACGGSSSSSSNSNDNGNDTSNNGGSITHNGTTYGTVKSPYTGRIWLDRNLGAARVCESYNDTACYGDYYQWGRNFDGHQDSRSETTNTLATDIDNPGNKFITTMDAGTYYDWTTLDDSGAIRSAKWSRTDGSSVCPVGFRVPTITELKAELLDANSAQIKNSMDAFKSFLKFPFAGGRSNSNSHSSVGVRTTIRSTTTNGSRKIKMIDCYSDRANIFVDGARSPGGIVRCIKG